MHHAIPQTIFAQKTWDLEPEIAECCTECTCGDTSDHDMEGPRLHKTTVDVEVVVRLLEANQHKLSSHHFIPDDQSLILLK